MLINFYYSTVLTIGFNSTTYTVKESDGSVPLSIGVIKGALEDVTVRVKLITISGSANGKLLYALMHRYATIFVFFSFLRLRQHDNGAQLL